MNDAGIVDESVEPAMPPLDLSAYVAPAGFGRDVVRGVERTVRFEIGGERSTTLLPHRGHDRLS